MKDGDAGYCYYANDEGGDYDAHDYGHMPAVDGGEHLSGNDAAYDAVSNHQDGIQDSDQLRWPVSHYISSHNLERP